jgi:hypothetical protein
MPTGRGYATFVSNPNSGPVVEIATIRLESLAHPGLAALLEKGDPSEAAQTLSKIAGDTFELKVQPVQWQPGGFPPDQLPGHLAALLNATDINAAAQAWATPLADKDHPLTPLVAELLAATVLIEHSDPSPTTAGEAIAAATIAAGGAVLAATISAGIVTGGLVLIVSGGGIVIVGIGAGLLARTLLRRR